MKHLPLAISSIAIVAVILIQMAFNTHATRQKLAKCADTAAAIERLRSEPDAARLMQNITHCFAD